MRMQPGPRRAITRTEDQRAIQRTSAKTRINGGKRVIHPLAGERRGKNSIWKEIEQRVPVISIGQPVRFVQNMDHAGVLLLLIKPEIGKNGADIFGFLGNHRRGSVMHMQQ